MVHIFILSKFISSHSSLIRRYEEYFGVICFRLGMSLNGVNMQGANAQGSNFQGANLQQANLQGANLQSVNLAGANVKGADFNTTMLSGVMNHYLFRSWLAVLDFRLFDLLAASQNINHV